MGCRRIRARRVDRDQDLTASEESTVKAAVPGGIDHRYHRGCLTAAKGIEVQHALDRCSLQAIDNRGGLTIKKQIIRFLHHYASPRDNAMPTIRVMCVSGP